jgi:hypothetical protein
MTIALTTVAALVALVVLTLVWGVKNPRAAGRPVRRRKRSDENVRLPRDQRDLL